MAYIYNIKSRDGSKIIATFEIPSQAAGGTVNFDTTTGIASFIPVIMNTPAATIYWMPNTDGFLGLTNSPNKTTTTFLPNGQSRPLPPVTEGTPYDFYEAYEGDEADNGYRLFYDALGGYLTGVTTNTLYNVIKLPDPLPNAVKQTVGGGFLPLSGWYYDENLTDEAYGGTYLNNDTTLYAKYVDDDITVNVYDNSGNTLKASQTVKGTTSYFNVYTIANSANLDIALSNGLSYSMEWARDLNQIFKGLAITPNSDTVAFPIGITQRIITTGTIDLYEVYEDHSKPTRYSIIYSTNGGTLEDGYPNPETNLTNVPEYLPTCTKEGYIFDGWYYDVSFNNPVILGAELTSNTTLYAKFTSVGTIDIVLYQNKSENNRVNKKSYLSKVKTMRGTFRQSVNIINPTITIEAENLPQFNYVYISSFGRYYFVTSIVNVNTNMWQIGTRCDVLYSYANTINSQKAFVARNENVYGKNINDGYFPISITTNNKTNLVKMVNGGGNWQPTKKRIELSRNMHYVAMLQGNLYDSSSNIISPKYGLSTLILTNHAASQFLLDVMKDTQSIFTDKLKSELIYSLKVFPFYVYTDNVRNVSKWVIRNTDLYRFTPATARLPKDDYIQEHTWEFEIRKPHGNGRTNYLNYSPYSTLWVEFLPFGRHELDTKLIFGENNEKGKVYITTKTNIITGESSLYWRSESSENYYITTSNVALDIPFSSAAISNQRIVSGAVSTVSSIATSIAAAIATQGMTAPIAVAGIAGALSGAGEIASAISSPISSVHGGTYAIIDDKPRLILESKNLIGTSYDTMGSALQSTRKLNTLSGFTQVSSVNLQGFSTATDAEVNEVEQYLKSGVIL